MTVLKKMKFDYERAEEKGSKTSKLTILVGGFNPSEKYACQIGSFPQVGVKIKIFETTT